MIDATRAGVLQSGELSLVVSSSSKAYALTRAAEAGIPSAVLTEKSFEPELEALLKDYQIDLIILAGFMRILSPAFTFRSSITPGILGFAGVTE